MSRPLLFVTLRRKRAVFERTRVGLRWDPIRQFQHFDKNRVTTWKGHNWCPRHRRRDRHYFARFNGAGDASILFCGCLPTRGKASSFSKARK